SRIEQLVDHFRVAQRDWIGRKERWPLHPLISKGLLVRFQIRAADNSAAIGSELSVVWLPAEAGFVKTVDVVAGVLKLHLDEGGTAHANAPFMNATGIRPALGDSVGPISETTSVRLSIEEIQVVLANEELRVVYRIRQG